MENEIINETMENMEHAIEEITPTTTKGDGSFMSFLLGAGAAAAAYGAVKLIKRVFKKKDKKVEPEAKVEEDNSDVFDKELPEVEEAVK